MVGLAPKNLADVIVSTITREPARGVSVRYKDFNILQANANKMDCFGDGYFQTVLCKGVFEHDKFFWKTLSEIKQVTKPGGLIVIGTPGYTQPSDRLHVLENNLLLRAFSKLRWLKFVPLIFRATHTLEIHNAPGDYYRCTAQTFRDIFFEGMKDVEIRPIITPPITIGSGFKPG